MKALSLLVAGILMCAAVTSQVHAQATPATPATPTPKQVTPGTKPATPKAEAKPVTLKGEIVDMGCYLGHGAKGADHKACALKCIAGGMPMGLLTADGKLYLLTMDHDNADPFNKAKDMASMNVDLTGMVMDKGGMRAIEVTGIAEATPAAK
jgi:hypothetical protein